MRLLPLLVAASTAFALLGVAALLLPALAWGEEGPALLLPPGLGRPDRVWIAGRVLHERYGQHGPRPLRTARVLAGRNRPGVAVEVTFLGLRAIAVSGHDGEFEVELAAPPGRPFPPGRHRAEVRAGAASAVVTVEVVPPDAPFLLVSDFDDTVAITHVTDRTALLVSIFLRDAEDQPAVPGMAALYRDLTACGAPLAFVSGSPVQLAPRLERFLEKNGFPAAALVLRNVGRDTLSRYKEPMLERLATRFPALGLVLVGDSGERDPEVYAAFMRAHPGRVLRAYLRQATPDPGPPARFEGLFLFREPAEVAADAAARGLLPAPCPARGAR